MMRALGEQEWSSRAEFMLVKRHKNSSLEKENSITYVLKVEGVNKVGHVVAAPVRHLGCVHATVSFSSEVFLYMISVSD